jgi:hypothetical protein
MNRWKGKCREIISLNMLLSWPYLIEFQRGLVPGVPAAEQPQGQACCCISSWRDNSSCHATASQLPPAFSWRWAQSHLWQLALIRRTATVKPMYSCPAKNQYQKFKTNIPRKGIARPHSQFPHSCVCELFIYYHGQSDYSAAGNKWTDPRNI